MPADFTSDSKIFIQEFNCRIAIRGLNPESNDYIQIRKVLRDSINERAPYLYTDGGFVALSLVEDVIKRRLERRGTKAYLTAYKEYEGSFVISFIVLTISTLSNYGGIRESIDYVVGDVKSLLEGLLGRGGGYTITDDVNERSVYSDAAASESLSFKKRIQLAGLSSIILIALGISIYFALNEEKNDGSELSKAQIELLIKERIDEAFNRSKIDYLYHKALTDTTKSTYIVLPSSPSGRNR